MDTKSAYDLWSKQYDTNENKTRDLEAEALRKVLKDIEFNSCLEIGCGTGKNTVWLLEKVKHLTAVDFSEEMIAKAKEKIKSEKIKFIQADITKAWNFTNEKYDLVSFSLVLEHIENLSHVFKEAPKVLSGGGYIYMGELHPYKQYGGTKARFETKEGLQILDCFNHNISDFVQPALTNGFEVMKINEFFDDDNKTNIPRVLTILFTKK